VLHPVERFAPGSLTADVSGSKGLGPLGNKSALERTDGGAAGIGDRDAKGGFERDEHLAMIVEHGRMS
jgi:hypothetical protein